MSMIKIHNKRMSKDELTANIIGIIIIGLFALMCVIPFYLIIVASLRMRTRLLEADTH
jgi:putative aldouronate transport system permease protein